MRGLKEKTFADIRLDWNSSSFSKSSSFVSGDTEEVFNMNEIWMCQIIMAKNDHLSQDLGGKKLATSFKKHCQNWYFYSSV